MGSFREVTSVSPEVFTKSRDVTEDHGSSHSSDSQFILIWMFVFLSIFGMFGNSFSIYLLTGTRTGRSQRILSPTYRVYIIALAVADNGMLFFTGLLRYAVVDVIYETETSAWFYEVYLCRWHRLLMHTSHNAAVWLLVVMAVDRFIAVSFPFKYREMKHDPSKAVKITAIVFILSLIFASPFLLVGPKYDVTESSIDNVSNEFNTSGNFSSLPLHDVYNDLDRKIIGCSLTAAVDETTAYTLNILLHVLLAFLIPYFVLLLLNVITLRCLHCSSNSNASWRQNLNRKITVMMLVVCFTFIILWLPQTLVLISSSEAHSHAAKNETLNSLAAFSGLLNSALNFALYCLTVEKFRRAACNSLSRILCCKRFRDQNSRSSIIRQVSSKSQVNYPRTDSPATGRSTLITPSHRINGSVVQSRNKDGTTNHCEQVQLLVRGSSQNKCSNLKETNNNFNNGKSCLG